jgi:hypothetical protein
MTNLVCPHCGSEIEVFESLDYDHTARLAIYCGGPASVCGATWSRYGDSVTRSKLEPEPVEICPEHRIPDANGNPIATPAHACLPCAQWLAQERSK